MSTSQNYKYPYYYYANQYYQDPNWYTYLNYNPTFPQTDQYTENYYNEFTMPAKVKTEPGVKLNKIPLYHPDLINEVKKGSKVSLDVFGTKVKEEKVEGDFRVKEEGESVYRKQVKVIQRENNLSKLWDRRNADPIKGNDHDVLKTMFGDQVGTDDNSKLTYDSIFGDGEGDIKQINNISLKWKKGDDDVTSYIKTDTSYTLKFDLPEEIELYIGSYQFNVDKRVKSDKVMVYNEKTAMYLTVFTIVKMSKKKNGFQLLKSKLKSAKRSRKVDSDGTGRYKIQMQLNKVVRGPTSKGIFIYPVITNADGQVVYCGLLEIEDEHVYSKCGNPPKCKRIKKTKTKTKNEEKKLEGSIQDETYDPDNFEDSV